MKNYLKLIRADKPIGTWLLFLPCLFGIALMNKSNDFEFIYLGLLFFAGAFLMRSAGCIVNDILDKNFDKNSSRTKIRPLAAGHIPLRSALIFLVILLSISLLVLLQFNNQTIILGFISLVLVLCYPLMKRITFYPQVFLGMTFNVGILFASTAVVGKIVPEALLLYLASIIWTVIYDTIYGYQDLEDDLKIGVKSTSIKFGKKPQKILLILAFGFLAILLELGVLSDFNFAYYSLVMLAFFHIVCQIKTCDFFSPKDCLKKFKSNIWVGIILLLALILA